jgi:hypothetical protein
MTESLNRATVPTFEIADASTALKAATPFPNLLGGEPNLDPVRFLTSPSICHLCGEIPPPFDPSESAWCSFCGDAELTFMPIPFITEKEHVGLAREVVLHNAPALVRQDWL